MKNSGKALAVVTGASSGIGLELARQFAQNGFDLMLVASSGKINTAAEEIRREGVDVQALQVDLATPDGVETLYQAIKAGGRPLDSIAINAGVGVNGAFVDTDLDEEISMISLNIISAVHLAKRVLKDMLARDHGRILFTASIAGLMPAPYMSVYGATKAFLYSFSEGLRNEVKDTGVTVTALLPGATETDFFQRADMENTKVAASKKDDPADVARDGFLALMEGKDHVVSHSGKTRVQAWLSSILPEPVLAEMHGKQSKPGSASH